MSEISSAEAISDSLEDWFRAEHASSSEGVNKPLDTLAWGTATLALPWDDVSNGNAAKTLGHVNRIRPLIWGGLFVESPNDDYLAARQLFGVQMLISGCYKNQCYAQATDQSDFLARKFGEPPIGIDIPSVVSDHLVSLYPDPEATFSEEVITIDDLTAKTAQMVKAAMDSLVFLHARAQFEMGRESSETVESLKLAQQGWLELAVDHIAFAAQVRDGSLAEVPFLEARSISEEPQVYYPFHP